MLTRILPSRNFVFFFEFGSNSFLVEILVIKVGVNIVHMLGRFNLASDNPKNVDLRLSGWRYKITV